MPKVHTGQCETPPLKEGASSEEEDDVKMLDDDDDDDAMDGAGGGKSNDNNRKKLLIQANDSRQAELLEIAGHAQPRGAGPDDGVHQWQ